MELLDLYQKIDEEIMQHFAKSKKKAPCAKGCASCCSQFFEISFSEYQIIKSYILQLESSEQVDLKENSSLLMDVFKKHHPDFYNEYFASPQALENENKYYKNSERFRIHIPCVFLTEAGACSIYAIRPLVCRTTGVSFITKSESGAICREIRSSFWARKWQANLTSLNQEINNFRWSMNDTTDNQPVSIRQYPMFYLVYQTLQ